jgi:hypothetical protein
MWVGDLVTLSPAAACGLRRLPWLPWTLRISTGWSSAGPNQMRKPGIELSHFTGWHRDVVLTQDQSHVAREDVEPFVAFVGAELGLAALGRNDHLPHVHST